MPAIKRCTGIRFTMQQRTLLRLRLWFNSRMVFVVRKDLPASDLMGFVGYAKAHASTVQFRLRWDRINYPSRVCALERDDGYQRHPYPLQRWRSGNARFNCRPH